MDEIKFLKFEDCQKEISRKLGLDRCSRIEYFKNLLEDVIKTLKNFRNIVSHVSHIFKTVGIACMKETKIFSAS